MPTSSSRLSTRAPTPMDQNIFIVAVVLVIFTLTLIGLIIYITTRLKKRRPNPPSGPYEGSLVHPQHLAAQITPFGGSGPHVGRDIPRFTHTPGENMRIAFRRPDGAWHFADSLTPFAPVGVNDIDFHPPSSTSTSECSFNAPSKEEKVEDECKPGYGFSITPTAPPPPAYHCESYNEYFDRHRLQV